MILEQTVSQVLREKGSNEVFTVGPDESVANALQLMARQNIGALLVMEGDQIAGIISERDYARRILISGRSSRETRVREIMTTRILYVTPDDPIEGVLVLMTNRRIRHVPVLDHGALVGMVSIGDVVKAVVSDQEHMIDQLVRYVTGSDYGWHDPSQHMRAVVEERVLR